jgi:CI repressor-like protein/peptidase S24-like protein
MQEENIIDAGLIIQKLKKALKIKRDIQLSHVLNIRPNTISTWKKRNTLDYPAVIAVCQAYELDLNEILLEKRTRKLNDLENPAETKLVSRELQFQYCMAAEELLEKLPKYNFPFIKGENTRAFQVLSNNMFPMIEENSFVICEEAKLPEIQDNSLVVIISRTKGLFINRIHRIADKRDVYLLTSENTFFNNVNMKEEDINEIWMIKAALSYNMNIENKFKFINDSIKVIDRALLDFKSS